MKIIVDIPDEERFFDGVAKRNGYSDKISDNVGGWLPTPESRDDFVLRMIKELLVAHIKDYEIGVGTEAVKTNVTDIDLTISSQ